MAANAASDAAAPFSASISGPQGHLHSATVTTHVEAQATLRKDVNLWTAVPSIRCLRTPCTVVGACIVWQPALG
jgi:hypothetical protein